MPITKTDIEPILELAEKIAAELAAGNLIAHDGEYVLAMRVPAVIQRRFLYATKLLVSEIAGNDGNAEMASSFLKDQIEIQAHTIRLLKREIENLEKRMSRCMEELAENRAEKIIKGSA